MPQIRRGLIASASDSPVGSLVPSDPSSRRGRRIILFTAIGIASYLVAMIATIPVGAVVKRAEWRTGSGGTIWNGELGVGGGSRLAWSWAPLRSLTSAGFATDWTAQGRNTDLAGRALIKPSVVALDGVAGNADGTLLTPFQSLPFRCDVLMQVDLPRVVIGGERQGAEGRIASEAGSCAATGAAATPSAVPPLLLTAEQFGERTSQIRLVPREQRRTVLIDAKLQADGRTSVTTTQEGARVLPFLGLLPGATLETEL